jgi:hypothetical protein
MIKTNLEACHLAGLFIAPWGERKLINCIQDILTSRENEKSLGFGEKQNRARQE